MRRIVIAPSMDEELLSITAQIDDRFGPAAADAFDARFRKAAEHLADLPRMGTLDHGYPTQLYGFVLTPNWVFYRFSDDEITFLHIRDNRRLKGDQHFED